MLGQHDFIGRSGHAALGEMDGEQISPGIGQTQQIEIGLVFVETALCLGIAQVL